MGAFYILGFLLTYSLVLMLWINNMTGTLLDDDNLRNLIEGTLLFLSLILLCLPLILGLYGFISVGN